jgi:electron transfer flavoprotein beta subunit
MKILVAIKQVAALDEDFEIRADGLDVEEDFLVRDLNEWDDYSLEEALRIKEAAGGAVEVVVVTVADEPADEALRKCLAKGADRALRVWDESLVGSDAIAIARVLAAVTRRESPDMLFAGVQSSDQAFAATGIATAALLDWPHAAVITRLEYTRGAKSAIVQRELEGGVLHELQIECPAVLTIQLGINTPRYASLRAIKQAASRPIELLSPSELGLAAGQLGAAGSAARVRRIYVPERSRARMIEGSVAEQAAELARVIRERLGGTA